MISVYKRKKLTFITVVYWFLLVYIITALVWWFIALEEQNTITFTQRMTQLDKSAPSYIRQHDDILNDKKRKTSQYIGEGVAFLLVILVGALFVYRATRKQLRLSTQQQNFMMAVTHELKTPIAVINLNLETLQKRKLDEEKQQRLIQATLQESDRLNTLTTNILITSQLESGSYQPDKEDINFSQLTEDAVFNFSNRYHERIIKKEIQQDITLRGERVLLQLLVNNLLDNALKYSSKEKPVAVELYKSSNRVHLKISDEGSGISDEEKKKIFEKFYRSGNESTRKTKGTGLGLYLCKRIADSHKAKIRVTDNQPSGSIFIIEFKSRA